MDANIRKALASAKKAAKKADIGATKRRGNGFLARYLSIPTASRFAIRTEDRYRAKSYNLARQAIGLVDHLFVRYRVPLFLYRSVLSYDGIELVFGQLGERRQKGFVLPGESKYRHWFMAVAQGASFAKAARDVLTKREAHWFLQAPPMNTIEQNLLWARAAAADVPRDGCDYIVERFDAAFLRVVGDRLPDLLRFYANEWSKMRRYDRDEITDFVRAAAQSGGFSFKGRTFGSMRKLSHEWHRTSYAGSLGQYRSWAQGIPAWEHRQGSVVVRAVELTNNRALVDEGRKQCHCVYSYTWSCISGSSRIVSVRWYAVASQEELPVHEIDRLTVEVWPSESQIVQVRGRQNRRASDEEMKVLRIWAGTVGLRIGAHAN